MQRSKPQSSALAALDTAQAKLVLLPIIDELSRTDLVARTEDGDART